ncbi:3-dehydroquinate dehydratase [endosymbiont of Euscepes postfasciatus]|uniref:type II 3-dehydroquinate dehydratase n=1 Tax=endosymbiont of Euscepes postfasciatus TaxID=650377 RepID=UPI000DC72963|nr:type II 3-dehydroquinate dehydratase [endosymbiont of Euscepes postfasciatus]BBA84716.1 3-dehydroquinate dehydratase [endosymbiont of Euscepes postfasciatus]
MNFNIFLINGPNLGLLGSRENEIYGNKSLNILIKELEDFSKKLNINLIHFQSNSESKIINFIHKFKINNINFIIINAGAYSHTSIAIRDALKLTNLPIIEVHISNIYSRETFRRFSYISDISLGVICGFGTKGYFYSLEFANIYLNKLL